MAHSSLKSQQAHGAEIHHRTMISDHSLRSSAKEISIEDVCSLPVGDTQPARWNESFGSFMDLAEGQSDEGCEAREGR